MNSYRPQPFARSRHLLTASLTSLLFVHPPLALAAGGPSDTPGEIPSSASLPEAPLPEGAALQIEILDGEGALNNIRQRTAREPIVQVEDKNHKPVAGALVLFTINTGPSGAGASISGATTLSVVTGPDGKAVLRGLKPNNISGQFSITVSASSGTLSAAAVVIHQANQLGAANLSSQTTKQLKTGHRFLLQGSVLKTVALVSTVVATGTVVGVVAATKSTTGTQITTGTGTVTAP